MLKMLMISALLLSGCTTAQIGKIDTAVRATAPEVCNAILEAHTAFVAVGLGSENIKAQVEVAYNAAVPICAHPESATALQLAVVTAKTGVILYNMNRVKASG